MSLNSSQNGKSAGGKRRTYKAKMVRVNISIQDGLLNLVDEAAEKDFTSRSDIIRMALLWYLRPQSRDLDQTDPDVILKTLQHRRSRAAIRELMRGIDKYDD